jgi:hypothetical protein
MSNLDTPLQLSAVRILNTVQTRSSFLSSLLVPLLSLSQQIHAALYPFGIFKTIDVRLETAQSILAPEGSVDVVVDVKEVPRWYLKSGTEVGAGEGGAYVTANVRNVFGGAETLGVQFSTGTKTRLAFEVGVCLFFLTATFWELKLISLHAENRSMLLSPSPSPPPSFPPHLSSIDRPPSVDTPNSTLLLALSLALSLRLLPQPR